MKKIILAGCVILDSTGRLLLIHRNTPGRTQWETPGGKIEEGEKPESTAIREIEEEIGIKVNVIRKLGEREFTEDNYFMDYIWFLAKVESGNPSIQEKEKYDGLQYFTWEELHTIYNQLSPNAQNLVNAYFNTELNLLK